MFTSVLLKGTGIGINTDVNGYYSITKVPVGEYILTVVNMQFAKYEYKIEVKKGEIHSKNIYLKNKDIELEVFEVSKEAPFWVKAYIPHTHNSMYLKIAGEELSANFYLVE